MLIFQGVYIYIFACVCINSYLGSLYNHLLSYLLSRTCAGMMTWRGCHVKGSDVWLVLTSKLLLLRSSNRGMTGHVRNLVISLRSGCLRWWWLYLYPCWTQVHQPNSILRSITSIHTVQVCRRGAAGQTMKPQLHFSGFGQNGSRLFCFVCWFSSCNLGVCWFTRIVEGFSFFNKSL